MSSLLIKGAKLTDCWNCPCVDGEYYECNILGKAIKSVRGRLDDCPLIELPDHGDLIDRDALNATDSWEWIRHGSPVVIPAERSEDE